MLSLSNILIDGLLLSALLSVLIFASLRANARLWLQDYPAPLRALVPPLSADEKRSQRLLTLVFLALVIGTLVFSVARLRAENGGTLPFLTAWAHIALVFNFFNLWDAVVIDYLVLTLMQPKFVILPGTEGHAALYNSLFHDWRLHVGNYLKGVIISTVLSLPLAFVAVL
ncbi:MAG: hypothetical protein HXY40_08335 [Chloroflexi bacterium]|nr:hypothetical protein [Chloroflexota bacterium]